MTVHFDTSIISVKLLLVLQNNNYDRHISYVVGVQSEPPNNGHPRASRREMFLEGQFHL